MYSSKTRKSEIQHKEYVEDNIKKNPVFNIRKAQHEVKQFVISGLHKGEKEDAKVALAISLGAKPPKKEYRNYKELLAEKRKNKQQEEIEALKQFQFSSSKSKKKRRNKNDVTGFDSQLGKYRSGVQVIKKREFYKIKKRKQ